MHILLIEPDRLEAEAYTEALQREGHSVTYAVSAQSAVHEADNTSPDLVVLELQLPRHNGVEFLYEFRSYHEWLHVPIIVYTYVPLQEVTHASTLETELGVVRVLYKPMTTLRRLCEAVQAVGSVTI
jgi:DNA-binding response OmpR family regulator